MRNVTFLLFFIWLSASNAAEVRGLRTSTAAERVRVVFDMTAAVEYSVFLLESPNRVVIDFAKTGARPGMDFPGHQTQLVKGFRYARRGRNGLRMVLELEHDVEIRHQPLGPNQKFGHRVVLDLLADAGKAKPMDNSQTRFKTPPNEQPDEVVIAIDPGHGGEDVGAIGPRGTYEKDVVLAVARELKNYIDSHPSMRAVLTRNGDYYLKLRTRLAKARKRRADLFVSIHADAFHDQRVRGSSVYVLSQKGASSEAAKWLADHENAADLIGGVTLEDKDDVLKSVLIDLSQTASIEASIDAANDVLKSLGSFGELHRKHVQKAGFVVLKSPDIPSILVEMAFISNPLEEERLRDTGYRKQLASAIYTGIVDYFESSNTPGVSLALNRNHTISDRLASPNFPNQNAASAGKIESVDNGGMRTIRIDEVLRIP